MALAKLVYVLDDDEHIRTLIEKFLVYEGFSVQTFKSGEALLERYQLSKPDCFVLDVMLPDVSGFQMCTKIRQESTIPILFVSAKGEEMDRILGIELGGDDYLTKPFSGRELAVRVKALLRRSAQTEPVQELGEFALGNLAFKLDQRVIAVGEAAIPFTTKEYDLFLLLSRSSPKAFSREELLRKVWKWEVIDGTRSVDDLVKRIRRKLLDAGADVSIKTVFGFGYKVIAEPKREEHENPE
jgi:DNA-binding response OmpR family regulator